MEDENRAEFEIIKAENIRLKRLIKQRSCKPNSVVKIIAEENYDKFHSFRKKFLAIFVGFFVFTFIYVTTMIYKGADWGYVNIIIGLLLVSLLLMAATFSDRKLLLLVISGLGLFLLFWVPQFIRKSHAWTPYFDLISHFLVGWTTYHIFSALLKRRSPLIPLLLVIAFEITYEIVEYAFFWGVIKYPSAQDSAGLTQQNTFQDFMMNFLGGLFGLLLDSMITRRYFNHCLEGKKMPTVIVEREEEVFNGRS